MQDQANNQNLYLRLSDSARNFIQNATISTLQSLGEEDR